MDTDYVVPSEVDRIRARVTRGDSSGDAWTRVFELSSSGDEEGGSIALPASFGVLPGAMGLDPPIHIELAALEPGTDRVLVERRVQTSFIPGQTRLARVLLYRVCESLSCDTNESCGCVAGDACSNPGCVSVRVEPDVLETIDDAGALPPDVEFPVVTPPDPDPNPDPDPDPDPDPPPSCDPPLERCGDDCVNLSSDPAACGSCTNVCPTGWECSAGTCLDPDDCRNSTDACVGFSFCNPDTGTCDRGCVRDQQCEGANERCDTEINDCVCQQGFEQCRFDCVDTANDPRFCGDCMTICKSGEVCDQGSCIDPGDCRNPGVECAGFTFCDAATGDCVFGCDRDAQCTAELEVCDQAQNECVCADDAHLCGSVCRANDSLDSCGDSCVPCPVPENGSAVCDGISCGFECGEGFEPCEDACCPEVDPCSCEANAIECGQATLCDVSIDCGTCPPDVAFCIDGTCGCEDPFEPNGLVSTASPVTCGGGCNLRNLDETVQGSLDSAGDFDFFEIDLRHESARGIELIASDLESSPQLYLTYICDDGTQDIQSCSGSYILIGGVVYCRKAGSSSVTLEQTCPDTPGARGTLIFGLTAVQGNYVGPCDLHSLRVRSFRFDDDD